MGFDPIVHLTVVRDTVITAAAIIGALGVIVAAVWKPVKEIHEFLRLWNGEEKIVDSSNSVVQKKKPGIPALITAMSEDLKEVTTDLAAVREQVQNHHVTNLRDDLTAVQDTVAALDRKMSEHISISKAKDAEGEATAQALETHLKETEDLMPMLKDLHADWHKKPDN